MNRRRAYEEGFTLIEVIVAMVILLVGVLAAFTMLNASSRANASNRERDAATNLARDVLEAARNIPYERLTSTGSSGALQAIPGLEDSTGPGYDVKRRGISYTLALGVCVVDDPADGGGPRPAGATFCPSSTAPGTADPDPEDYKRVTTTVTWRSNGQTRSLATTGVISNPGSSSGPAIRSIAPLTYTSPYVVTNQLTTSITVEVTTSSRPATINWLLDGSVQQPSPVMYQTSGLVWRFPWDIGAVDTGVRDGDYVLSAEASNTYGVSGPTRQMTITLNRRIPFKPRQVTGGRTNFGTVEIEWTANSERDIVGYEVVRNGSTVVCALATQKLDTICTDPSPPAGPLSYTVRAYDKNLAGQPRPGDWSDRLDVVDGNQAPFAPTTLTAARAANGTVTLTWKRPSPQDPDSGDAIEFYRIYRDGQALDDRYARWFDAASTVTWSDLATNGATHTYWVTAVDKHYAESPYLGPVTA